MRHYAQVSMFGSKVFRKKNLAIIHTFFQCLNHFLNKFIEQESCPQSCICRNAPRGYPGRRNVQGSGPEKGYCFYYCDPEGYCGASQEAKAQGKDCKLCREKFYGY